jgi:hypothetical protein
MKDKSFYEIGDEIKEAREEFLKALFEALKIEKLCDKIEKFLQKFVK